MMTINVQIQAPELSNAIQALAGALGASRGVELPAIAQVAATAPQVAPAQHFQAAASPAVPVAMYQQPVQAPAQPAPAPIPAAAPVPTAAQAYTLEQLAVAATPLMDAGKREQLVQLLAQFGVSALTQLPKEQYGAFATQLRALGAKI